MENEQFIIDKRVGIIAILDTLNESYKDRNNGVYGDESYVIASWNGKYTGSDDEDWGWDLYDWQIEKAKKLCKILNHLKYNKVEVTPSTGYTKGEKGDK